MYMAYERNNTVNYLSNYKFFITMLMDELTNLRFCFEEKRELRKFVGNLCDKYFLICSNISNFNKCVLCQLNHNCHIAKVGSIK